MPITNRLTVTPVTPAYWSVSLNNPPINLFDPEMFAEFNVLMERLEDDKNVKVVVLESADPRYFISHFDIVRGGEIPDQPGAADFSEWPRFVTRLAQSRVVSVAKLRGRARGHGSELALACDIRFASKERAILAQPEVGASLVPGGGSTEWLPALVGRSRALEIFCGADDFDADTAEKYGWVNRSIPDAELDAFVDRFARRVANFDKKALELAKKTVNARGGLPTEAERWGANRTFTWTTTWPETQAKVSKLMGMGLQQDNDLELNFGKHIGELVE
jgi:enoyl-CoA hydratase/carnithine racemase